MKPWNEWSAKTKVWTVIIGIFIAGSIILRLLSPDQPATTASDVYQNSHMGTGVIASIVGLLILIIVLKPILMVLGFGRKIFKGGKKAAKWRHDRKFKVGERVGWSDKTGRILETKDGKARIRGDDEKEYRGVKFDDLEKI